MVRNGELKNRARAVLEAKWMSAALFTFVFYISIYAITFFVVGLFTPLGENVVTLVSLLANIILLPLVFGFTVAFYRMRKENKLEIKMLYKYYDEMPVWTTMILKYLYLMLWVLPGLIAAVAIILLMAYSNTMSEITMTCIAIIVVFLAMIPYYVKYYSYSMTEYIMTDNPGIKNNEAIEMSMRMMQGKKEKLFVLDLSFIGWAILAVFTLGIGFLFLIPYWYTTRAAFYESLKAELNSDAEDEPQATNGSSVIYDFKTENTGYTKQ